MPQRSNHLDAVTALCVCVSMTPGALPPTEGEDAKLYEELRVLLEDSKIHLDNVRKFEAGECGLKTYTFIITLIL